MYISDVRIHSLAFADPPLFAASGLHAPLARRTVIEKDTVLTMRRFAFNLTALTTLALLPNQYIYAQEPPTKALPPLTIELRNARLVPGEEPSIMVDFVMKNNTKQPLVLVERWNSWGAYQWTYEVTDATGKKFSLENPQMSWKRNFLSFFTIKPGSEFLLSSFLDFVEVRKWDENGFVYKRDVNKIQFERINGWKYPVKIVGKFTAQIEKAKFTKEMRSSNWAGTITTAPITVKAPATP